MSTDKPSNAGHFPTGQSFSRATGFPGLDNSWTSGLWYRFRLGGQIFSRMMGAKTSSICEVEFPFGVNSFSAPCPLSVYGLVQFA